MVEPIRQGIKSIVNNAFRFSCICDRINETSMTRNHRPTTTTKWKHEFRLDDKLNYYFAADSETPA